MSIIHQALKKVQAKLNQQEPTEAVSGTRLINEDRKKVIRLAAIILLPTLTLGCLWYFIQQIQPVLKQTGVSTMITTAIKSVAPASPAPVATKQPPPTPVTPTESSDEIQLQGIMAQGSNRVALINNKIYQLNDDLDGMKIIAINDDNVIVNDGGQKVTYKLGH